MPSTFFYFSIVNWYEERILHVYGPSFLAQVTSKSETMDIDKKISHTTKSLIELTKVIEADTKQLHGSFLTLINQVKALMVQINGDHKAGQQQISSLIEKLSALTLGRDSKPMKGTGSISSLDSAHIPTPAGAELVGGEPKRLKKLVPKGCSTQKKDLFPTTPWQ